MCGPDLFLGVIAILFPPLADPPASSTPGRQPGALRLRRNTSTATPAPTPNPSNSSSSQSKAPVNYGTTSGAGSSSNPPEHHNEAGGSGDDDHAPPTYAEAVKGDHKIQSDDS
ncbi:hypothetical protein CIB48_g7085 [Xylaria polymorpha]|nr:hypothetical protein CIB48_g7085 [Xylaria polymorpha]